MSVGELKRGWLAALLILYGTLILIWLAFSGFFVPAFIEALQQGRLNSSLARALQARMHRAPDHYQRLWSSFVYAVAWALVCHLSLTLLTKSLVSTSGGRNQWGRGETAFVFLSALFLGLTVLSGPRHDYVAYVEIWERVWRGGDPWEVSAQFGYPLNAYGPLFNLLTIPAAINPLLPKLLFATSYLAFAFLIFRSFKASSQNSNRLLLAILYGPFVWVEIAYFGHFDILVALVCISACLSAPGGREGLAGFSLAAGVLLKYIPLSLLPFFLFRAGRFRPRFMFIFLFTIAVGTAMSWLIWGNTLFRPLAFATGRPSTFASIFRFLRGPWSPLTLLTPTPNLDRFSLPSLLASGLFVFVITLRSRAKLDTALLLAAVVTLTFYRVGFLQYQMIVYVLATLWIAKRPALTSRRPSLFWALAGYLAWFSALDLVYAYAGGVLHPQDPLGWLDDIVGLPSFLLGISLIYAFLRSTAREDESEDVANSAPGLT